MFYVIGNSPKKVELKDLNDCIYYKQQKVYTDSQYESSVDLKRAIERKILIVLKKSEDTTGSFDINTPIIPSETKTPEPGSSPEVKVLLEKIRDLEGVIKSQSNLSPPSSQNNDALAVILDRLEKLEKNPASIDLSIIQEALKNIESRMQSNRSDGLLEKLEGIISRSGGKSASIQEDNRRVEDVYIPNIRVEDANSHIKLEVRTIDSGDSVFDSLRKLKELKSKST
jgi:hypothetical protein